MFKYHSLTILLLFLLIGNQFLAQNNKEITPESKKITSSNYHTLRSNLNNSFAKFENEKKGRVAFLGGSITQNKGWRDSVCTYLLKRFPETKFEFVEAGIGSMGTTSAAFRLERDVLSKGTIDLLFEEAAVNDRGLGRTITEQIRGMEGIVRHTRKVNPATDIIIMHFVDPSKINNYKKGKTPKVIQNHEKVASYYNISTINLAKEVADRIDNGEFTWKDDFKNLHPSSFGQGIYAHSIISFLENNWSTASVENNVVNEFSLPKAIDNLCYENGVLVSVGSTNETNGWNFDKSWVPGDSARTRKNYFNIPMLIGEYPSEPLTFNFEGTTIGIVVVAGPDAGIIEYNIDGNSWIKEDLFSKAGKKTHIPKYITLGSDLKPTKHTLQVKLSPEKNSESKGHICRILNFYINR